MTIVSSKIRKAHRIQRPSNLCELLGLQANSINLFLSDLLCIVHCQSNNLLRFEIISLYTYVSMIRQGTDIYSNLDQSMI
jgi:hypothetical protein